MNLFSKYKNVLSFLIVLILSGDAVDAQTTNAQKTAEQEMHLADPCILPYGGQYYLYGTVEDGAGKGFKVYLSTDLKSWKLAPDNDGYALKKGETFGTRGFWAPQVFFYRNKFFMAYVANENIAIAQSDRPSGPFIQTVKQALDAPVKQIDPFIFIDDDGRKYLYHVRLENGNKIFVAEMTDDFAGIKPGTLHECITATEQWENTANSNWPVTEGPSVIKHKKEYYLFYTANDFRNPDYAVGYATSKSPLGPWTKNPGNPVLNKKMVGYNGTGHGDFFTKRKKLFYVFHTHNTNTKTLPRKTAIIQARFIKRKKAADDFRVDAGSFYFLEKE